MCAGVQCVRTPFVLTSTQKTMSSFNPLINCCVFFIFIQSGIDGKLSIRITISWFDSSFFFNFFHAIDKILNKNTHGENYYYKEADITNSSKFNLRVGKKHFKFLPLNDEINPIVYVYLYFLYWNWCSYSDDGTSRK